MPIFNDLYYNAPSSQYVKKPIQDFVNAASSINQTYDKNKSAVDAAAIAKANLTAMNDVHNKQQQDAYDEAFSTLQPFIENNNYEDAGNATSKAALMLASNPLIKNINEEKIAYDNFIKEGQEAVRSGKISEEDFRDRVAINSALYSKPITIDPVTSKANNKFTSDYIPNDPKIQDQVKDLMKTLREHPDDIPVEIQQKIQGYIDASTATGVTEDKLRNAIYQVVLSNPANISYLQYQAENKALLNRLDSNGNIRPYDAADLIQAGIIDANGNPMIKDGSTIKDDPTTKNIDEHDQAVKEYEQAMAFKNKLIPDGKNINQDMADYAYKTNLMQKQIENITGMAGAYDYHNYKLNLITDKVWDANTDMTKEANKLRLKAAYGLDANDNKTEKENNPFYEQALSIPRGSAKNVSSDEAKKLFPETVSLQDAYYESNLISPELGAKLGSTDIRVINSFRELEIALEKSATEPSGVNNLNVAKYVIKLQKLGALPPLDLSKAMQGIPKGVNSSSDIRNSANIVRAVSNYLKENNYYTKDGTKPNGISIVGTLTETQEKELDNYVKVSDILSKFSDVKFEVNHPTSLNLKKTKEGTLTIDGKVEVKDFPSGSGVNSIVSMKEKTVKDDNGKNITLFDWAVKKGLIKEIKSYSAKDGNVDEVLGHYEITTPFKVKYDVTRQKEYNLYRGKDNTSEDNMYNQSKYALDSYEEKLADKNTGIRFGKQQVIIGIGDKQHTTTVKALIDDIKSNPNLTTSQIAVLMTSIANQIK